MLGELNVKNISTTTFINPPRWQEVSSQKTQVHLGEVSRFRGLEEAVEERWAVPRGAAGSLAPPKSNHRSPEEGADGETRDPQWLTLISAPA